MVNRIHFTAGCLFVSHMLKVCSSCQKIQPSDWRLCAVAFLEGVTAALAETKQPRLEQPVLFLRMHVAQYQLAAGSVDACKAAVSCAKDELDCLHDVRPWATGRMLGSAALPLSAFGCFAGQW